MFRSILIILVFPVSMALAQEDSDPRQGAHDAPIEPFMMLQLWGVGSFGQESYNSERGEFERVDDRINLVIRRARLGFRARITEGLKFTLVTAYDQVGRDLNAALKGGANNGSTPEFGIWDAFLQWRVLQRSDALHLTVGYFRPQLSRESITSGWEVNSMEKAMSQTYIRKHLTGRGPGRSTGLNLGGLVAIGNGPFHLDYNLGVFSPVYQALGGQSSGRLSAPLLTGRTVIMFGDPERSSYSLAHSINAFGKRKGLSLGAGGAWQGNTDLFDRSYALSTDLLFNWGSLNLDGEWNWMWREGVAAGMAGQDAILSGTGHLRVGYNISLSKGRILEPVALWMGFRGEESVHAQQAAADLGASSGAEDTWDLGANLYLEEQRMKLMIHYTIHRGSSGESPDFAGVNDFFNQKGVGAIRRGDWLGAGLNLIF